MSEQLSLFSIRPAYRVEQPQKLMSKQALLKWKARIFKHQQYILNTEPPQQTSLFYPPKSHCDSNSINPFALKLHNSQFYRMKKHGDRNCIYFIIDNALPLLLYVGETKQTAKQRWNGTHDCKDYMMNYVELHRKHNLEVKMCSAFWYDTPSDCKSRLKLERELILRWQSPFNKENWNKYGKPFGEDKLGKAIALGNLSLAYQQLGQWQSAETAIAASLKLLPNPAEANLTPETAQILAQTLNVRGRLQLKQGKTQAALNTWQQTTALYQQLKDEVGIVRAQINQAQAMRGLGLYRQAETLLIETVELLQDRPDSTLKAMALRSLGDVFQATGNLKRSRQILEQSLAIAKATRSPVSDILLGLGNTARAQNLPQAALDFYRQATSTSKSSVTRVRAQLNQLSLLVSEDSQAASRLATQIESQIEKLPPSRNTIYARINLADNLKQLERNTADIARILTVARQEAESLNDTPAISYASGNLAEVYAQSEPQQAIALTQQALYLAQAVNAPEIAYRWQWQLGRLLKSQGNIQEAIAAYTEAVQNLEFLSGDLAAVSSDMRFNFRTEVEPVYRQLVDLLLSETKTSQSQIESARSTIESLQIAELVNFFQEDCLIVKSADFVDEKAAIIYTILLGDRLETILSLPGQNLRHYATPVTLSQVERLVAELRQNIILPYTSDSDILPLSQQVYDWLIKPAQSDLEKNGVKTLAFVLDGALQNLPMAVLHDGQQYLVEKYALAITPGLQLFDPQPLTQIKLEAITAGLTQARFGFAPLQYVEPELKQIESEISAQILLDREFTTTNLNNEISSSPTSIVHVATHGQFSSQAEDTFILAWDRPINVDRLDKIFQIRPESENALELLVLSACETAVGDERAALGIAGVAVRSGARSTLASLWLVDDRSTAQLMSLFYKQLNAGVPRGEALRLTQRSLLQSQQYSHPRYWAAFVLLGNWL